MIKANFIVDPDDLKKVVVPKPVAVRFIDTSKINFLGETGLKMASAGFRFLVTEELAKKLIEDNVAIVTTSPREILPLECQDEY